VRRSRSLNMNASHTSALVRLRRLMCAALAAPPQRPPLPGCSTGGLKGCASIINPPPALRSSLSPRPTHARLGLAWLSRPLKKDFSQEAQLAYVCPLRGADPRAPPEELTFWLG